MEHIRIYWLLLLAALLLLALNYRRVTVESSSNYLSNQQKAEKSFQRFQNQLKSFQAKNDSLSESLIQTQKRLERQKQLTNQAGEKLNTVLKSNWTDLSEKERLIRCDSLISLTGQYEVQVEKLDSLQGEDKQKLLSVIAVKEEQIDSCNAAFSFEHELLAGTLEDLKNCELSAKNQRRENRWLKIKNGVLSVAAATLTVVTVLTLTK